MSPGTTTTTLLCDFNPIICESSTNCLKVVKISFLHDFFTNVCKLKDFILLHWDWWLKNVTKEKFLWKFRTNFQYSSTLRHHHQMWCSGELLFNKKISKIYCWRFFFKIINRPIEMKNKRGNFKRLRYSMLVLILFYNL